MTTNIIDRKERPAIDPKEFKGDIHPDWCPGCGDFGVLNCLQRALAELGIPQHEIAIISGIGCSSNLPGFINTYGMHTLHGRALPNAQGFKLSHHDMTVIAVGGDGDGYGIGVGHFVHALRRNVDLTYIVMNNSIYGLTTGQTSPTSDIGMKTKSTPFGNPEAPLNPMTLALGSGASFVSRAFTGNPKQTVDIYKAAIKHKGFALVDTFSPCVTFNNNVGSTKSYDYVREHVEATGTVDFVPMAEEIKASYTEGNNTLVKMHDGSYLELHKLATDWNPQDRISASMALQQARAKGEILTGLLYVNTDYHELHETLGTTLTPLNELTEKDLCPGAEALSDINAGLR